MKFAPDSTSTRKGFEPLDQERTLQVETPEHVRIDFDLAGAGSRGMAVIADLAVIVGVLGVVALILMFTASENQLIQSIGQAWLILIAFILQFGYFFIFELVTRGRTPGKRMVGLRVVSVEGTPITVKSAALRNVLRLVDLQPVFTGVLGLGMIAVTSRGQRIGDIVAGTVVVRDQGGAEIPEAEMAEGSGGRPLLAPEQFELLDRYIQRHESLTPAARRKVAGRVRTALGSGLDRHFDLARNTLDDQLARIHAEESARQMGGLSAQAVRLFAERRDDWRRFDELVERARSQGIARLTDDELESFTELYRQVGADLARARTYGASLRLRFALERRVASGHNLFYRGRDRTAGSLDWIRGTLPSEFRRHWRYVALSALLLFGPALGSYATVRLDPASAAEITSPVMIQRAADASDRLDRGEPYVDVPQATMPLFSSSIMTNNLRVAIMATAGGVVAGLGTLFILVFNGVHLGSAFGVFDNAGAGRLLWEFVLPHGVIELTAIVIAGAAGLMLGSALILPGRMTRGEALREKGALAVGLLGGALVLLVIAGLIEGFISPADIPVGLKMSFSALVAALTFLYLGTARRSLREAPAP